MDAFDKTLYDRLYAAAHAIVNDTEGDHPFSTALEAVLELHEPQDPPGPTPGPIPGVCATCGNTGVVHGPGANGNWTDDPCGCDTSFCGDCQQAEPCATKLAFANALDVKVSGGAS